MRVHPTELRGKATGISAKRETESRICTHRVCNRSEREPCIAKRVCPLHGGVFEASVRITVSLGLHRWPNGGNWSRFLCPGCDRWARILRLLEGQIMCWRCCRARGLRARVELIRTEKRAAYHAPRLIARLTGPPARLNPRPGRMLDRRANIEARLRRAGIVARQFAIDEHDKQLAKMNAKPLPRGGPDEADPTRPPHAFMRSSSRRSARFREAYDARSLVQREPAAKFTISVGVGTGLSGPSELEGLLRQTEAALYRAKSAGGNRVASGLGRLVRCQSAPDIKRVPMRSAKPFVSLQQGL
jgi:GGDEF domain-containing protein